MYLLPYQSWRLRVPNQQIEQDITVYNESTSIIYKNTVQYEILMKCQLVSLAINL